MTKVLGSETILALKASFSEQLFNEYLKLANGDMSLAVELYIYNAQLAGSFIFPLGVFEITLRNAVDKALVNRHGRKLHTKSMHFLKEDEKGYVSGAIPTGKKLRQINRSKLISRLQLGFWVGMFSRSYYKTIWKQELHNSFPHGNFEQETIDPSRQLALLKSKLQRIKTFRNNAAHQHILLASEVLKIHEDIIDITGMICPETARWPKSNSTVNAVIDSNPLLR